MSDSATQFNWTIDETVTWPPRGRPRPPLGPTIVEVLRSCPLRVCFEASSVYERRLGFAARVGTAFHRVLQSLNEAPPLLDSAPKVAEEARRRFAAEVAIQVAEADSRPRERGLRRDPERLDRAAEAVVVEALRIWREGRASHGAAPSGSEIPSKSSAEAGMLAAPIEAVDVEVEVPVRSRDGLFSGRVDRAEHWPEGTVLLDYKSALRDDLPERYERQLQLYALMWHDTRGEWPAEGYVIYPLTASTYCVAVQPEVCRRVGTEAVDLVDQLCGKGPAVVLARPGEVCQVCEFRPWCRAFWEWQASEPSQALALERANLGFEGEIVGLRAVNYYWKLQLAWRGCTVQLVAPQERFSQLTWASVGMRVRALEMRLRGQRHQPQATVSESSELYLLLDHGTTRAGHG